MNEQPDNHQNQPELPPTNSEEQPAVDMQREVTGHPIVVGIGASAGGLAALQQFFDTLPDDSGMAFVVITHMDPKQESLLPEILQNHTGMLVRQVQEPTAIEPNHVYIIPPGRRILITNSHLDTEEFEQPRGRRRPVDHFFRSLAQGHRQAVAVILSGGGTDGAVGIKTIKEEGGLLLVQEPMEAEYDSMPRAAIATGLVDLVLPVDELARKLVEYHHHGLYLPAAPEEDPQQELDALFRILAQVQVHTGHDFSQYKRSTLLRRIRRRMQLNGHQTMDVYLSKLRHDVEEARVLFSDLLIGVTSFFRDTEAWQALSEEVIPRLFEGKEQGEMVRVWSIGCATGEEAYSLAMLLMEYADSLERPSAARPSLQVFASDLDEDALQTAREGIYPAAIAADVSPERLARWFVKEGHYYRVRQELRDTVLFASHNVLRDPPFSRLDLISCRNLLIYLNRDLQANVFRIFHYALRPEAFLFLGSAESAEMMHELFNNLDRHHRLYRVRPSGSAHPHIPSMPLSMPPGKRQQAPAAGIHAAQAGSRSPASAAALHETLLEAAAPPSILIDANHQILHISQTAGRYLFQPGGAPTKDLLQLARPELQFELRNALFQVFEHRQPLLSRSVFVQFDGTPQRVILSVRPQLSDADEPLALVFFLEDAVPPAKLTAALEEGEEADGAAADESRREQMLAHLEEENRILRERLQTLNEEYESSHEELKAANEELQSINEEYRSTTEELETSKEELQSVNEELQTVNAELKNKLEEISRAHGDLENLMTASDIATLFLDRELRIQRYTASTARLFNVMPGDRGRPLEHLTNQLQYDHLTDDAREVLRTLVPVEHEVQDNEGRWFLAQLRPYRTLDDRIDGVVLTFVEINELKKTEAALRNEKEFSEKIIDTVREGLLVLKPDLTVEFANNSFYSMFAVGAQETIGNHIYSLGNGQWDIPELRTLLEEILPDQQIFNNYRVEYEFETVGHRIMLLNARRLAHVERILLSIQDISDRERYEEKLRALNETLEHRVTLRTSQVEKLARQLTMAEHEERARIARILHDDLQQLLFVLQVQLRFLDSSAASMTGSEALRREIAEMEANVTVAIKTARQLSVDLSPPILDGEGLVEAIGWLAVHLQDQFGLEITVEAPAGNSFPVPALDRRVLLFQTVRELLFNITKHAGVTAAEIKLQVLNDPEIGEAFRIDVRDEGVGFDPMDVLGPHALAEGSGLRHAQERLRFIGGRLEVSSKPGDGTQITIIAAGEDTSLNTSTAGEGTSY